MDTPVELLVSYTNQSIVVTRRAVRIRVIVYVLEDLDGVAQIVTIRIIAIEVILPSGPAGKWHCNIWSGIARIVARRRPVGRRKRDTF